MPEQQTIEDLGKKVKAKYPGQYDDLADGELGRRVKAKFPGAYDDFADAAPAASTPSSPEPWYSRFLSSAKESTINSITQPFVHPIDTATSAMKEMSGIGPRERVTAAVKSPDRSVGGVLAASIPFFGPGIQQAADQYRKTHDVAATAGTLAPTLVQAATIGAGMAEPTPGSGAWNAIKSRLPSEARAGSLFNQVKAVAKDVPIDTSAAQNAVEAAKDIRATGGGNLPTPMSKFNQRMQPVTGKFAGQKVTMQPQDMTYEEGFKFASNAGRVSSQAAQDMTPAMKRQLGTFAKAMKDANREAAVRVGMGDTYDAAMKEYRNAKTIEDKVNIIKEHGVTVLAGAAATTAGAVFFGPAIKKIIREALSP